MVSDVYLVVALLDELEDQRIGFLEAVDRMLRQLDQIIEAAVVGTHCDRRGSIQLDIDGRSRSQSQLLVLTSTTSGTIDDPHCNGAASGTTANDC